MTVSLLGAIRTARGVARSLQIYYGDRGRRPALAAFYARFLEAGDLAFDIGAHVGDRIAAFRRLGARVVAVEPQPALVRTLKLIYGRDPAVVIEPLALADKPGVIELRLNIDNPTVSTASLDFISAASRSRGWEGQTWTRAVRVSATTLDAMVARHGLPVFVKIDVEGFEAEVLEGLTQPVRALSFEFTTIQRAVALAAIRRCMTLGYRRFNAALGENLRLVHEDWLDGEGIAMWISGLPQDANSGDVYATHL